MMAPKLRFSRSLKPKAPSAATACVPAPTPLVEIFTGPSTEHKKQRWWRWGFFSTFEGLSSVWLLFYQRFDAALLLWSSPNSWLGMFPLRRCSYILTDDPSKTSVHCELEYRRLRSQQFCEQRGHIFPPGTPVTSFLSQPISTVIPVALTFNKTKPSLSSIAVVTKAIKRTARTSLCRTGNIHNAVSRHLDKNHTKHRRTVFSRPKRASSAQRTDEEDTSETCNINHVGGRALSNAQKRKWGWRNENEVGRIL